MLSTVMGEMVETTTRTDYAFRRESLEKGLKLEESTNSRARNAYGEQKVLLETHGMISNMNHKERNSRNGVENIHPANSKDC